MAALTEETAKVLIKKLTSMEQLMKTHNALLKNKAAKEWVTAQEIMKVCNIKTNYELQKMRINNWVEFRYKEGTDRTIEYNLASLPSRYTQKQTA